MKFLVIGCGSIGERHIRNLQAITGNHIDVFDPQQDRLDAIVKKYSVNPVTDDEIDSRYDCTLICTPPNSHISLALRAAQSGSNVFIEKPLSSNLEGIEELVGLVNKKQVLGFVAYNFRFNKGINMVKQMIKDQKFGKVLHASAYFGQYLPDWRPWQDYKKSYTARKDLGGGIIHDGSHEIDYLVWLLGRPNSIQSQFVYTDTLAANTEAIVDILLQFGNNIAGSIHLDFIRRQYRRSLEILCDNGIIQWSLSDDPVKVFDSGTKEWHSIKLCEDVNDMYIEELKHVIRCIETRSRSEIIDLENGAATLRLSDAVYRSGLRGQRLSL